jgi:hypothetical protein
MDPIKEAFDKIKQDILSLKTEISQLKDTINMLISSQPTNPTIPTHNPTQSYPLTSTPAHNPTHPTAFKEPIIPKTTISTGNRGVPTDNPTDRQTIQQTDSYSAFQPSYSVYSENTPTSNQVIRFSKHSNSPMDEFERAKEVLDSLDIIKREIRLKFKRLTPQEMQVFSVLYTLEEQKVEEITYKSVSQRLNLTESSIRDYITKLISKGIPILKVRQNNKKITLHISEDLQKVASLSTIIKLREI